MTPRRKQFKKKKKKRKTLDLGIVNDLWIWHQKQRQ